MTVFYIRLKTGEEMLGNVDTDLLSSESNTVFVTGPITFDADPETGSTIARYWIAYSDTKDVNIDLNDTYFFGLANEQANKFYDAFLDSVKKRDEVADIDGMTDDDLEEVFDNPNRTLH